MATTIETILNDLNTIKQSIIDANIPGEFGKTLAHSIQSYIDDLQNVDEHDVPPSHPTPRNNLRSAFLHGVAVGKNREKQQKLLKEKRTELKNLSLVIEAIEELSADIEKTIREYAVHEEA